MSPDFSVSHFRGSPRNICCGAFEMKYFEYSECPENGCDLEHLSLSVLKLVGSEVFAKFGVGRF
jgi:hypothetical protein